MLLRNSDLQIISRLNITDITDMAQSMLNLILISSEMTGKASLNIPVIPAK